MRDYASLNKLWVPANMESYNAVLISKGMEQKKRMIEARKTTFILWKTNSTGLKGLEDKTKK